MDYNEILKNSKSHLQLSIKDQLEKFIIVIIKLQKLLLINEDQIIFESDISTSKFGIGNKENSFMTPLGSHIVCDMIGDGYPIGTVFKGR